MLSSDAIDKDRNKAFGELFGSPKGWVGAGLDFVLVPRITSITLFSREPLDYIYIQAKIKKN